MSLTDSPGDWTNQVRKRVRAALAEHEITATEVARRIGWSQSYIAHRLSPKARYALSVADISAIAAVLGVAPQTLIPEPARAVA